LVAACAIVAELIATAVSILRLRRRQSVPLCESGTAVVYLVASLSLGFGVLFFGASRIGYAWAAVGFAGCLICILVPAWRVFPELASSALKALPTMRPPPADFDVGTTSQPLIITA